MFRGQPAQQLALDVIERCARYCEICKSIPTPPEACRRRIQGVHYPEDEVLEGSKLQGFAASFCMKLAIEMVNGVCHLGSSDPERTYSFQGLIG
jgi:hypothetical protein